MNAPLRALTDALRASVRPGDDQWPAVLRLAAAHDLLPSLWRVARDGDWFPALPVDALAAVERRFDAGVTQPQLELQRAYEDNAVRLRDLLDQGERLLEAIPDAVPLKGWHAVRAGWYADPNVRVMRDLDLLITDVSAATAAVAALGYEPIDEPLDDYADHQLPAVARSGRVGSVELHTALVVSRWRDVLPAAMVGRQLSTTHAVVHLIAHAQLHDEAFLLKHRPLRALHETAVVAVRDDIDWSEVRARFDAVGGGRALDAHLYLARDLFGADVPVTTARLHARLCDLELTSERAATLYRKVVFVPRALSATRMHKLYGAGNVWRLRVRHLARHKS